MDKILMITGLNLTVGLGMGNGPTAVAAGEFIDHGVAAPVAESRGVVVTQDAQGHALVLACSLDNSPQGWILVTDVDTGETQQIFFPEGVPNSPPYASLLSRNGRFYTAAGRVLLEFDPSSRQWLFHGVPQPQAECFVGEAFADGPDGRIYGGTYPNCHLISFDPQTKQMADYGPMDPQENYFTYLAFDQAGWAYCGIGTARYNLVAFNPKTRERRQILPEEERALGTARVYRGIDGKVYGNAGERWYQLWEGKATPVDPQAAAPRAPTGEIGWGHTRGTFPDGRKLRNYHLPERWLEVEDPSNGTVKRITFDYRSEGASITSLVAGPDGRVYGSTAHPMHFFAYSPDPDRLEDWGPIERIGGGNICAMAVQGPYVVGAAYSGGWLYLYDPTQPWNGETGDSPNPRLLAEYPEDICRPRTVLAHPDGHHVLMAGYMGYGRRGGGLAFYDLATHQSTLIPHEHLIPDQSTITLKALPDGNLVGGTSIETPGGGHPTAQEGVLYLLDWATRKVVFQTAPVPGATSVFSLEVGPDGRVYGLTTPGSDFFVFDPATRQVIHRESLAEYGGLPRPALLWGPEGKLYGLFTKALVQIEPQTFRHQKLADAPGPLSAGAAILKGRLYFAIGSHLWSYGL